jgi:hypothetical protein
MGLRSPYRPPRPHTKGARNWRRIAFGERIVDKHCVITGWEAVSVPY